MKAVIFSINRPHTDNIKSGVKGSELRTKPPKIKEPYKAFIYETKKNGGCGKVIGEFTAFNKSTYRMCMGVPKHLVLRGCVSAEEILDYTNNGKKDLTEISISNLVIYDKPKELSEFIRICPEWEKGEITEKCLECEHLYRSPIENLIDCDYEGEIPITRPPQSWCYCESEVDSE